MGSLAIWRCERKGKKMTAYLCASLQRTWKEDILLSGCATWDMLPSGSDVKKWKFFLERRAAGRWQHQVVLVRGTVSAIFRYQSRASVFPTAPEIMPCGEADAQTAPRKADAVHYILSSERRALCSSFAANWFISFLYITVFKHRKQSICMNFEVFSKSILK